jgi:putative transcriptional regulator
VSRPKGHIIQAGQVLLAQPFMLDPHFKRASVLLCEHNDEGSLGFIMNKPLDMSIDQLVGDFPEFESKVLYGGPVSTDTLHYVHNVGEMLDDSVKVSQGVFWGGDFEKLKFLIESELIKPKNIRFFIGYSGWSEGQLMEEMESGSWVIADMHANYLFKASTIRLWNKIMKNKGDAYSVIAELPENISPN